MNAKAEIPEIETGSDDRQGRVAYLTSSKALLFVVAAGIWLLVINHLRVEWSHNEQYSYGWVVPLLSLYLFWKRWETRPAPGEAPPLSALLIVTGLFAISFLPLRMIAEACADWRFLGWGLAAAAIGLSFSGLLYLGGWPWFRHFSFPILFFLVAVPWSLPFELAVMHKLMHTNAAAAVEVLLWFGVPATQQGNLIELSSGVLGVEEACSGVRSLQTSLMISLFLGELYRYRAARRIVLLLGGIAFALLCNFGRTLVLVWLSVRQGNAAVTAWHDTVGMIVLVICTAGLWALAPILRPRSAVESFTPASVPPRLATSVLHPIPRSILIGLALWVVFTEAATQVWFRMHETRTIDKPAWTIDWPVSRAGFQDVEIPETTWAMLRYNEGRCARWREDDGTQWKVYFFRWLPGKAAAQITGSHRPEVCLSAAGLTLKARDQLRVRVGDVELPFDAYRFEHRGEPLHVFYCLWEDRKRVGTPDLPVQQLSVADRLIAVAEGRRNLGQKVLEIAVWNAGSDEAAREAVTRQLTRIISQQRDKHS